MNKILRQINWINTFEKLNDELKACTKNFQYINNQDKFYSQIHLLEKTTELLIKSISSEGFYSAAHKATKMQIKNYIPELVSYINLYKVSPDPKIILDEILHSVKRLRNDIQKQILIGEATIISVLFYQFLKHMQDYLHQAKKEYGSQARMLYRIKG